MVPGETATGQSLTGAPHTAGTSKPLTLNIHLVSKTTLYARSPPQRFLSVKTPRKLDW